jgi:hypothetical protein
MQHLCIARVGVKDVAKKFAGYGDSGDDEPMDVIRVNDKGFSSGLAAELGHAIKVNEEGEKDLVRRWTVFQDSEQVSFKGDRWYVAGVKGQSGRWREDGCA